jgi:CheY-like chemotaxis protein
MGLVDSSISTERATMSRFMRPKTLTGSQDHIIYVVDDDVRIREALAELFLSLDVPAATFGTVTEYLAYQKPDLPACLILDVELPDINGLDFQRQLRGADHPPIVFITGHGDIPSSVRAMKGGAVDFLAKPSNQQSDGSDRRRRRVGRRGWIDRTGQLQIDTRRSRRVRARCCPRRQRPAEQQAAAGSASVSLQLSQPDHAEDGGGFLADLVAWPHSSTSLRPRKQQ